MKASLQPKPMYCSRDYYYSSRFNQQYEKPTPEKTLFQLVLPATQEEVILKGCHNEVGHLGLKCMLDLMCDQFFWPQMAAQAKDYIGKCHPCLAFKAKQPKAPLENIMVAHPLVLVHLDYLCMEPGKGLRENVLVVTDHFTRYAQIICYQDPNCPNHCQSPMVQIHCPLWVT